MPAMKHLVVRSTPTPSTLAAGRRYKAGREFVHVMPEHVSSLEPIRVDPYQDRRRMPAWVL